MKRLGLVLLLVGSSLVCGCGRVHHEPVPRVEPVPPTAAPALPGPLAVESVLYTPGGNLVSLSGLRAVVVTSDYWEKAYHYSILLQWQQRTRDTEFGNYATKADAEAAQNRIINGLLRGERVIDLRR